MNQYNEPVHLNGVCCPISVNAHLTWRETDRFDMLKDYGFNMIRMGLNINNEFTNDVMTTLYTVLDHLIEIGMYAEIVAFNDETRLSKTEEVNASKTFLSMVAQKYKDYDNFIYTVGNEPKADIKMTEIDEYATEVMQAVLQYNPRAIIGVPTPCADAEVDDCGFSNLEYDNVIYIGHCYMSEKARPYDFFRRLQTAIAFNKAVYLSEWSAASAVTTGTFLDFDGAKDLLYLINKYQITNTAYVYYPGGDSLEDTWVVNSQGMIKRYYWDEDYREPEALTKNGNFLVNNLKKPISEPCSKTETENYTIQNKGKEGTFLFWNVKYKEKIKKVVFTTAHDIPKDNLEVWCMSESGLGQVYAYITEEEDESYTLTFTSDKTIYFPKDSSYYFYKFSALETVVFDNVDTSLVENMDAMFKNCKKLKEIDVSCFDFSNTVTMCDMFIGSAIKKVNFGDADFSKVEIMSSIFYGLTPTVYVKNEAARDVLLKEKKTLNVVVQK